MTDPTIERFLPGLACESAVTRGGVAWLRHGTGAPMMLFHGGAGSWNHWADNIPSLGRHFSVIGIDSPGYGASADTDREAAAADYLALVAAAADEILGDAESVHVAGFSFGALAASAVAAHLGRRAAGLTLVGGAGFRRPERRQLTLQSLRSLRAELGREPTEAEARRLHAANLGQLMIWDERKIDTRAIDLQAANVARTRFDSRPLSWSSTTIENLKRTTCPLQVIYGCHDSSAGADINYRIETCLEIHPDAEVEVLPACGHWAMYEAADIVNELMVDFHA